MPPCTRRQYIRLVLFFFLSPLILMPNDKNSPFSSILQSALKGIAKSLINALENSELKKETDENGVTTFKYEIHSKDKRNSEQTTDEPKSDDSSFSAEITIQADEVTDYDDAASPQRIDSSEDIVSSDVSLDSSKDIKPIETHDFFNENQENRRIESNAKDELTENQIEDKNHIEETSHDKKLDRAGDDDKCDINKDACKPPQKTLGEKIQKITDKISQMSKSSSLETSIYDPVSGLPNIRAHVAKQLQDIISETLERHAARAQFDPESHPEVIEDNHCFIRDGILGRYSGKDDELFIPDGVTHIAKHVFYAANSPKIIHCPDTLVSIDERAFHACIHLQEIYLNEGLKTIGIQAFSGCHNLKKIDIPDTVESIGEAAFEHCGLEEVRLPTPITTLPNHLFQYCQQLKTIQWPANVAHCGNELFSQCAGNELWEYFELHDRLCERILADPMQIDEHLVYFHNTPFAHYFSNRVLNHIWCNSPGNMTPVHDKMKPLIESVKLCAYLTDQDFYAAFHTIRSCVINFQLYDQNLITANELLANQLFWTAFTIGGNGKTWQQQDETIREMIHGTTKQDKDKAVDKIMDDAYRIVMNQFNADQKPNRYHPDIYHHTAFLKPNDTYWEFVHLIEGLLRFQHFDLSSLEVECSHENDVSEWMKTWSYSLCTKHLAVIRFTAPKSLNFPGSILALVPPEIGCAIQHLLTENECESIMESWYHGEPLIPLTLI